MGNVEAARHDPAEPTATGGPGAADLRRTEQTYIIATTPEAGSDFLARALRKTKVAGQPKEYFKPSGGRWSREWDVSYKHGFGSYVEAALRNATGPNGVFGATLQWEQFAWVNRTLRADSDAVEDMDPARLIDGVFSGPKYVWLRRRNTSRQAIDYYETIHSTRRRSGAAETPPPSTSDLTYVSWLEALLIDHDRQWSLFFERSGIEPLELYYGGLVRDWRRVVRKVLGFLDLERPVGGIPKTGRRPWASAAWSTTWTPRYRRQSRGLTAPAPDWVGVDRLDHPERPRDSARPEVEASDERVVYSCVTDQPPILRYQTLVWCLTLIELAGRSPDQLVVHAVEGTSREHQNELRDLGVKVVTVQPYDERNRFANKLRQLDSPALREADRVVLCDCDLAFCADISAEIQGDAIGAKVVDAGYPRYSTWVELARMAGLQGPLVPSQATLARRWTYANNINGGFLVVPREWLAPLAEAWPRWFGWTLEHGGVFPSATQVVRHAFQVAFGLAILEIDPPVRQLSSALNLSLLAPHDDGNLGGTDPLVLHYHRRLTRSGLIMTTRRPGIDRAIATVNRLLRRPEHRKTTAAALNEVRKSGRDR